ncbi:hypothetical protein ACFWWT_16655 [Streptomyces sp. NPDC058676]
MEAESPDREVRLEVGGLRHLDHACGAALEGWAAGREEESVESGKRES